MSKKISVKRFRKLLDAVHRPLTLYSTIFDLKNKVIYLYCKHNFKNEEKIDLVKELKKGEQSYDIPAYVSNVSGKKVI
ncbi:MAG: hypothetical protein GY757_43420 [bacterium]|nr:hypothetical protein [bacterium]